MRLAKFLLLLFILGITQPALSQTFLEAVDQGNHELVSQMIKDGAKVNKADKKGAFPLWLAVWNKDTKMVELLLKNGAETTQYFKGKDSKSSLLQIAAQEGLLDIAKLLVERGANIHERGYVGHTPLRVAARNGRLDLVKYFLEEGSDIDTRGDDGATPLEHAASKGHFDIVKLLVEKGANVNIQDKEGDFPLGEAARAGFLDVVTYLISKGADLTLKNNEGHDAQELARLAGQAKIEEFLKNAKTMK